MSQYDMKNIIVHWSADCSN